MSQKFYSETGERDVLSPKLQKISKESIEGRKSVYIPELRLTVFTKLNETVEQTRQRYLENSINFGIKKKEDDDNAEMMKLVDMQDLKSCDQ